MRVAALSPGKSGKVPCWSAWCKVAKVGENRLACTKATICAAVVPVDVAGNAIAGVGRGIVCRPDVVGLSWPCRVLPSACEMVQDVLSKVAVQPASHSWPNNRAVPNEP